MTEFGTVYSLAEIRAIAEVTHRHGLKLHVDGARFANAVASQDCSLAEMSWKAGVDVLSFGATKNGAIAAEAVVFFDKTPDDGRGGASQTRRHAVVEAPVPCRAVASLSHRRSVASPGPHRERAGAALLQRARKADIR